jgi:hypothetical protein
LQRANEFAKCGDFRIGNGPSRKRQRLTLQWFTHNAGLSFAGRNYLGLRRQKAPRLLDMLKALKAGGDQFNASGDTNEKQKGFYPY